MTQPLRVALLGFGAFEQGALTAFLGLYAHHEPAFVVIDDAAEADLWLVCTDSPGLVERTEREDMVERSVFVGSALPPEEALAWLSRPFDPIWLLRELDVVVALRRSAMLLDPETVPSRLAAALARADADADADADDGHDNGDRFDADGDDLHDSERNIGRQQDGPHKAGPHMDGPRKDGPHKDSPHEAGPHDAAPRESDPAQAKSREATPHRADPGHSDPPDTLSDPPMLTEELSAAEAATIPGALGPSTRPAALAAPGADRAPRRGKKPAAAEPPEPPAAAASGPSTTPAGLLDDAAAPTRATLVVRAQAAAAPVAGLPDMRAQASPPSTTPASAPVPSPRAPAKAGAKVPAPSPAQPATPAPAPTSTSTSTSTTTSPAASPPTPTPAQTLEQALEQVLAQALPPPTHPTPDQAPAQAPAQPPAAAAPASPQAKPPAQPQTPAAAPRAARMPKVWRTRPMPMPSSVSHPKALLVDDSEIALRFLELRLQGLGMETRSAGSMRDAAALLARHSFDVAFVDVDLGEQDDQGGLMLCQQIKQGTLHRDDKPPKVVMVTGHASATMRVRAELAGADGFLPKPIDATKLRNLLRQLDLAGSA